LVERELAEGRMVIPEPNDGVMSQVEEAVSSSLTGDGAD
jgi:hypothetical protein